MIFSPSALSSSGALDGLHFSSKQQVNLSRSYFGHKHFFNRAGGWFSARKMLLPVLLFLCLMLSGCSSILRLAVQQAAPTTPTPTRELRIDPKIELAPTGGYAGSYLSIQGDGWMPGQMVIVTLQDEQGTSSVLAAGVVDANGLFASGFLYPVAQRWLRPGIKTIVAASSDDALSASAPFTIESPEGVVVVTDSPATIESPTATSTPLFTATITSTVAITATAPITPELSVTAVPTATLTAQQTVTATQTITPVAQRPRPFENGVFLAGPSTGVNLDADLSLWSTNWIPVQAPVFGVDNYTGANDLAGEFQALWSSDGLYLAVRVRDDAYRSGPLGTDMWQGDSIEIHFDRQLNDDYDDASMNADDYQIGISFGPQLNAVTAYRWFPLEKEGAVLVAGAVRPTDQGYEAELLIPWSVFDVQPSSVVADAAFGFNLSLSDNDDAAPSQQTILSASPARIDHRTPPEWGTLILRLE